MKVLKALIVLFLISPLIILFSKYSGFSLNDKSEFFMVFKFTFNQALVSAFVSTFLGLLIGLSLSAVGFSKKYKIYEGICYFPCFIPTLFVVFSCLNISQYFDFSLQGFWGIVFLHSLLNTGLVGALYSKILLSRLSFVNRLSLVQGIKALDYFFHIVMSITVKDLLFLFSVVFIFCFTSFSIPLIIGGAGATTIELLIYEKLVVAGNIQQALVLSVAQLSFVVVFLLVINFLKNKNKIIDQQWVPYFKATSFLVLPCFLSLLVATGLVMNFSYSKNWLLAENLFELIGFSLGFSICCGYLMFIFSQLVFSVLPGRWFESFLSSYSSPSTVLVGLALVVMISFWEQGRWVGLMIGYVLLYFPVLFKMFVQNFVVNLKASLKLAQVMSAGYWLKFRMVSFPLAYPLCLFFGFLTAVWVMGDYALSSLLLDGEPTLALLAKSLMRSYQLEQSSFVIMIIILCEVFLYSLYRGLIHVSSKKY